MPIQIIITSTDIILIISTLCLTFFIFYYQKTIKRISKLILDVLISLILCFFISFIIIFYLYIQISQFF